VPFPSAGQAGGRLTRAGGRRERKIFIMSGHGMQFGQRVSDGMALGASTVLFSLFSVFHENSKKGMPVEKRLTSKITRYILLTFNKPA
jgi:hypothetical protein